jgi:hypothetical protein
MYQNRLCALHLGKIGSIMQGQFVARIFPFSTDSFLLKHKCIKVARARPKYSIVKLEAEKETQGSLQVHEQERVCAPAPKGYSQFSPSDFPRI